MLHNAKTVSIRDLNAAVKTALEVAKKKHPNIKIEVPEAEIKPSGLPLLLRYPWICGIPPFILAELELGELVAFNKTFVSALSTNPAVSALGVEGKFEPALYVAGGKASVGFVPADVSFID